VRKKEQLIAQMEKLHADEINRWRQKEQVLSRRIEQLQQEWRDVSGRLEHNQRDLMQYRKLQPEEVMPAAAPAPYTPAPTPVRTAPVTPVRAAPVTPVRSAPVTPVRAPSPAPTVRPTFPPPPAAPATPDSQQLEQVEEQVQRELRQWQQTRESDRGERGPDDVTTRASTQPPKNMFKVKPWMRLGK
jgi:hypothetical protein